METRDKQDVLNDLLTYADNHSLYIDFYSGCNEPGYDDKQILAANWNPPKMARISDWIEKYFDGDIAVEWSDEWTRCSDCYRAIRTSPDSYDFEPSFLWISDCEIVCRECWENSIDDIIETYKNDTNKAVSSAFYPLLEKAGFVCYSPDEYCQIFETGFHPGQNDDPQKIAADITENLPDYDFIFKIDSIGQFDYQWSVFLRKQDD